MSEAVIEDGGIVRAMSGNIATVEIERGGGCKNCGMHGFCMKNVATEFEITTDLPLQPGDRVLLDVSPSGRTLASLLIFGLPLAFLFIGFLAASQWMNELLSIVVGLAAMALSFIIVRLVDSKFGNKMDIRIARKL